MSCHWESGVPTSARGIAYAARTISPGRSFQSELLGHCTRLPWWRWLLFGRRFCSFATWRIPLTSTPSIWMASRFWPFSHSSCARAGCSITEAIWPSFFTRPPHCLLVTSKLQHATLALPLAIFLIGQVRWRAAPSVVAILCAAVFMSYQTPRVYKDTNLWNSVFVGLVPSNPTAMADLHLSPAYSPYINHNAYEFPSPSAAEYWETRLGNEMGYTTLAGYYFAHPKLALSRIVASARGLQHVRPDYLGNTQPGTPANTQSHRFDFFSTAKSLLFNQAPYLALVLYAAAPSRYRDRWRGYSPPWPQSNS